MPIIDVVTEQYFPRWLSRIEREMDVMSDRIRDDYHSIKRLTDEWVKDYRERMGRNVPTLSKPEAEM